MLSGEASSIDGVLSFSSAWFIHTSIDNASLFCIRNWANNFGMMTLWVI
jgi:hypothetical protein